MYEFDKRIADIKEGNERRSREELEAKILPELSEQAINSMAIYSAQESAS